MVDMKKQSGAVLMISLLVLLVITLLGVSSTHGTRTQERMAKHAQDRQVAFQTAETTTSWIEQDVFDDIGGNIFNLDTAQQCDLSVEDLSTLTSDCQDNGGNAKPWDRSSKGWENGDIKNQPLSSQQVTDIFGAGSAIAKDPRHQVVLLNLEKRKGFESSGMPGGLVATFVVTSLGYGEEENTTVKIQTLFNVDVGL